MQKNNPAPKLLKQPFSIILILALPMFFVTSCHQTISSPQSISSKNNSEYADNHQTGNWDGGENLKHNFPIVSFINFANGKDATRAKSKTSPETIAMQLLPNSLPDEVLSSWKLTGINIAKSEYGLTGEGIRIGIIDDGLDLDHPEFAGRVVAQKDFVGDGWNPHNPKKNQLVPDDTVDVTCPAIAIHGTHVTGIAAGNTIGIAPKASIGIYKIGDCAGHATSFTATLKALEQAIADDMDIVNISSGYDYTWPEDIINTAQEKGLIIVSSAGNEPFLYSGGAPGNSRGAISVASYENELIKTEVATREDGSIVHFRKARGFSKQLPTVINNFLFVGQGCKKSDYRNPLEIQGKTALIIQGGCTFNQKYQETIAAGAKGIVVYKNVPQDAPVNMAGIEIVDNHFAIMIDLAAGKAIKAALANGHMPSLSFTGKNFAGEKAVFNHYTGAKISSFSAYGPTPELKLKPDIGAPGGKIYSAVANNITGDATYAVLNGTSMASPHVAGAIALILEYRRKNNLPTDPDTIATLIKNTATPTEWSECDKFSLCKLGIWDATHRQGAGMINVPRALSASTMATPTALSLGESVPQSTSRHTITVQNMSQESQKYDLAAYTTTIATNHQGEFELAETTNVKFEPTKLELLPNSKGTFTVQITAPTDVPDATIYGGFIQIASESGTTNAVNIPFSGFKGDYQTLTALDVLPFLTSSDSQANPDGEPNNVPIYLPSYAVKELPANTSFSMIKDDVPTVALGLKHPAQQIEISFLPQGKLAWLGEQAGITVEHIPSRKELFIFGIDDIDASNLPNGTYKLRIRILKAGGNPENTKHIEIADTKPFIIDRNKIPPKNQFKNKPNRDTQKSLTN